MLNRLGQRHARRLSGARRHQAKKGFLRLSCSLFALALLSPSLTAGEDAAHLIIPGKQIGQIVTEMKEEQVSKLLGKATEEDGALGRFYVVYRQGQERVCFTMGRDAAGVTKVGNIGITSAFFKTAQGISTASS